MRHQSLTDWNFGLMQLTERDLIKQMQARQAIEQATPTVVNLEFTGQPLSLNCVMLNRLEKGILQYVRNHDLNFELYATNAEFRRGIKKDVYPCYRIKCPKSETCVDFFVTTAGRVHCLMLKTPPTKQGNGHALKRFIMRFAAMMFDLGFIKIEGRAMPNLEPVRNSRDDFRRHKTKDGTPKLIRLYEILGFKRDDTSSDGVYMTPDTFQNARRGSEKRSEAPAQSSTPTAQNALAGAI